MSEKNPSEKYRLMVYFAVATLHFYSKEMTPIKKDEKLGVFVEKNAAIVQRVRREALNLFGYDLSNEQIGRAIKAYLAPPQGVSDTEASTLEDESEAERAAMKKLLLTPIKELDISVRLYNDLLGAGIKNLKELVVIPAVGLLKIKSNGKRLIKKSIVEIERLIKENGLRHEMDVKPYEDD